jgi:deoxyribodipyrimidine photo-lyase
MQNIRSLPLNQTPFNGSSVVYVMSRDQRCEDNHALLAAQEQAIAENVPLYVLFVLKHAKLRSREHYAFMLEGLEEVAKKLQSKNIFFVLRAGDSVECITSLIDEIKAGAIFFDFSPLKNARATIKNVASLVTVPVTVVDTHNIIPVWVISDKQEFAAHTLRRKVHKQLDAFLVTPAALKKQPHPAKEVASMSFEEAKKHIQTFPATGIIINYKPGEQAARKHLDAFLENDLERYALLRNDIAKDHQSGLSPYLHFGQIASLRVVIETIAFANQPPLLLQSFKLAQGGETPSTIDGMNALLEEIIVRKELADNFCFYSATYTTIKGAAAWAQASLASHANDPRDFLYTKDEWEACATHDVVWNAAQAEMNKTGKLHGYLRMYWAKKILEWSASPEEAIKTAMYLNDKYSIDGGDPNGYVGILWSIAGLHDRPWFDRPVLGKIRYMNEAGLRRKYDVEKYIERVNKL